MITGILQQINWVDILVAILLIRSIYLGFKNGLFIELFKILGLLSALYISMHYYTLFSDYLGKHFNLEKIPLRFLDFLVFFILAIGVYALFVGFRYCLDRFIEAEVVPLLNRWGALILSSIKGLLLVSLVAFILLISSVDYLKDSVNNSYSGKHLIKVATSTYSFLWNNIFSKFMPNEKFNTTVEEVQSS
ncbi:MAG: CvpA family protein [Candidatus Omnitrophica bacterium]|nr:CvpA family protein [Candidatus Omnitrophota bacterium]